MKMKDRFMAVIVFFATPLFVLLVVLYTFILKITGRE